MNVAGSVCIPAKPLRSVGQDHHGPRDDEHKVEKYRPEAFSTHHGAGSRRAPGDVLGPPVFLAPTISTVRVTGETLSTRTR